MDRRSFLARSTLGSATALAGLAGVGSQSAGCGAAHGRPVLGAVESAELLTRLERGLAAVREIPVGVIAAEIPWQVRPEHHETILRLGIESLIVADVNRSVPVGTGVSRALAERVAAEVPMLERAVGTYHALLTRMPPAARRDLDRRIRERPDAPMDAAEWLDQRAGVLGIDPGSRLLVRDAASNMAARIRRQSASAVIDDALAKVERAVARSGNALAHAASATTVAMIDAIWQTVDGAGGGPSGTTPPPAPSAYAAPASGAYVGASAVEPTTTRWNESWARPGDHDIEIGAIMMPFGLITCTVLLWVGIGVLVHGISQNNGWDGRSEEETRAHRRGRPIDYAP